MTSQSVPQLDLAPKLRRPLSLWNPLDYLRLLYWAFFFPQAVRWYMEKFGDPVYAHSTGRRKIWESLQRDPIRRRLVVQGILVMAVNAAFLLVVPRMCLPLEFRYVALVVALFVALFVAECVARGVTGSVVVDAAVDVAVEMALGVATGVALGVLAGVALGVAAGVARGVARGVVVGVVVGVPVGVIVVAVWGVAVSRPLDWCLAWPIGMVTGFRRLGSHVTWLPLPGLRSTLSAWLQADWEAGEHNLNEMLAFSQQFVPVVGATSDALAVTPPELLLMRVGSLANKPFDWNLVRFSSADLKNDIVARGVEGLFLVPKPWRRRIQARYPSHLRGDTAARAACAGFWLWHEKSIDEACHAFEKVAGVRHGSELYNTAQVFVDGRQVQSLLEMSNLEDRLRWLDTIPDPELRPGTLSALRCLRAVTAEARVANQAAAPLNRSASLGRANAALTELIETVETTCPYPEWPLVQETATQWRDILIRAGGVLGEEVLRQSALNPYKGYSGLPVTGAAFAGRRDLLRQIETRWAGTGHVPPLILYGHRRMGKTSILKQMGGRTDQRSVLVYLNMQNSGWVDNTGDLLLDLAEAIHSSVQQAGLDAGPTPVRSDYAQFGDARYALNHLLQHLAPQMIDRRLVLAIDELEVIQDGLDTRRIDAGLLPYLRALGQEHPWLAFMFAGLHTLDEMGHDYRSAFYGQAEHLRVSYLTRADAIDLITRPHPDFALEYEPALREELYRLTYGQPYLLQRLCWELVNHWNERFLIEGKETPRTLTVDDFTPFLTPDFYHAAGYYFDGVWSNITEAERQLLQRMAARAEGEWTIDELAALTGQSVTSLRSVVKLLRQHDVVAGEGAGLRFASELMRRWVVDIAPTLPIGPADTGPGES